MGGGEEHCSVASFALFLSQAPQPVSNSPELLEALCSVPVAPSPSGWVLPSQQKEAGRVFMEEVCLLTCTFVPAV